MTDYGETPLPLWPDARVADEIARLERFAKGAEGRLEYHYAGACRGRAVMLRREMERRKREVRDAERHRPPTGGRRPTLDRDVRDRIQTLLWALLDGQDAA